jgi:crotonobetainyl-CoA:carnitine CoA-transferase CaiB-like acyl-CoA transferase
MISSFEVLADLWTLAGGDPAALARVTLTGAEPALPSNFRLGAAAQASIAAAGLAASEIARLRTGVAQTVSVDMRHAVAECRSERYLHVNGEGPPPAWDALAGVYTTRDGRFVRLHTNFPHHRAAIVQVLACGDTREAVQSALMQWDAEPFETAANAAGGVVAMMRSRDEWLAHPQGAALALLRVMTFEKIGDAPPRPWPGGSRPLEGLRVLDLSRVIAGPVAGRTLAAHGADVMLVASPNLPAIPWLTVDTGRGKLSAFADLDSEDGRAALRALVADADVFSQGYRPASLAARGFAPADLAAVRPGIVCVSLSAYGGVGPWAGRRGFDSLVQTATGFNHASGRDAGLDAPKELPAQILDHATGHLMAFGAMMARWRQERDGGSWHVRLSLAQTGNWLWGMGRLSSGMAAPDLSGDDVKSYVAEMPSGFGELDAVTHAALLPKTPAVWTRPSVPLGTDPPVWPARPSTVKF